MNKHVATIILNRNMPKIADKLFNHIKKNNKKIKNDIFIVEAGSERKNLSKNYKMWANWDGAMNKGLRAPRGFNYGLSNLINNNKYNNYDYFFMLTNDTEFSDEPYLEILINELELHPKVGLISPCAKNWAEKNLLKKKKTKYFWYLQNSCYLFRREFLDTIVNFNKPNYMNCFYDGNNFRGNGADLEIISKGYLNNWATALTSKTMCYENEKYLKELHKKIKTDDYEKNLELYLKEGADWSKKKYGFNSRWQFIFYVKNLYNNFFNFYPKLRDFEV